MANGTNIILRSLTRWILLLCIFAVCVFPSYAAETSVATAQASPIIATVPVGKSPGGIVVNPVTNRVYIANYQDGTVSVLDGRTNTVITTVSVGANPCRVAVNPITNRIYVCDFTDNNIRVLDGDTNATITTLTIGSPSQGIAVNSVTDRLYLIDRDNEMLRVFDGKMNAVINTITLGGETDVAVNPATNRIYVASYQQISVLDGKKNAVIANIEVGSHTWCLAVNPTTNRIYVTTTDGMSVLDGKTNTVLTQIKFGKVPSGVAVNPATSQVYISDDIDNTVSVLDGTTNTVSAMVPLMVKSKPCGIAVNPVTNRVYVTNRSTNSVSVLDGNTFVTESEHAFAKLQSTMPHPSTDGTLPPFDERFTAEKLDLTRWVVTRNEACLGSSIDIINRNATERWLRLRMETPGAPKLKRKCQGVRTRDAVINFERRTEIQFVLDWNNPALAQGLEAGIMLCPDARSAAPAFGGVMDYIKVLYAGEHAGAKAFITISVCIEGEEHAIYDEGYRAYSDDVTGTVKFDYRTIGVQRIRIILNKDEIAVWENDKQLCQSTFKSNEGKVAQLPWDTGYLYLQQAYGEDLPVRDVFFSNISVRQLPEQAKPR